MATRSELAQASDEDARVQAAIQATEEEIFAEANGIDDPENDGDKSLEEMEDPVGDNPDEESDEIDAQDEDEPEAEEDESEEEPEVQEPLQERRDERKERFVPSGRLREESERARAAEAEARELREKVAQLSGRFDELSRQRTQPQQPQEQPIPLEDRLFTDPKATLAELQRGMEQKFEQRLKQERVEDSLQAAHAEHGEEFAHVYTRVRSEMERGDPVTTAAMQRIYAGNPRNVGAELMKFGEKWLQEYRDNEAREATDRFVRVTGVDPETLNRALAMAQKGGGRAPVNNGQRQQRQQILPDLSNAGGGRGQPRMDPRGFDGSEGAIFADAFTPLR